MMAAQPLARSLRLGEQRGPTVWEMCRLLSGNGITSALGRVCFPWRRPRFDSLSHSDAAGRHDVAGKRPVRSEEFGTDVHELHHLPIVEKRELDIDLFDLLADRVVCFSARENAAQQDFAFRQPGAQFVDDGRHAFDDFRRGVARFAVVFIARIVRADEQHNDFGFDALEFAVFDAPEHVLGAVVADAELGGVARRVTFVPDIQPALVPKPAGGDGIARNSRSMPPRFACFTKASWLDIQLVGKVRGAGTTAVFSAKAVTARNAERINARLKQRCFMRRTYRADPAKAI